MKHLQMHVHCLVVHLSNIVILHSAVHMSPPHFLAAWGVLFPSRMIIGCCTLILTPCILHIVMTMSPLVLFTFLPLSFSSHRSPLSSLCFPHFLVYRLPFSPPRLSIRITMAVAAAATTASAWTATARARLVPPLLSVVVLWESPIFPVTGFVSLHSSILMFCSNFIVTPFPVLPLWHIQSGKEKAR